VRRAEELTIRPAADRDAAPQAEVVIDGRATGLVVPGRDLEAALEIDGRWLIFLTDGVPMEELLSIHLVSADGRLLDTASIGQMYSPGIFADLALEPPRAVRFRFLGDVQWRVDVDTEPRLAWPLRAEAPAVKRPFGFQRWFRVKAGAES
jgi:hypothetical protein